VKAVLCRAYGPPESLVVEDIPSPTPGPGEAVIAVKAASVNFPDVLIIQNKYQVKPPLPFSPGSEVAGIVETVGDGVTSFKPGDAVFAITTHGAFAEKLRIEAQRLMSIPAGMDFATAAAFGLTYATSEHALVDRGALRAGETLLVLGAAGGVGLAAIEIGKALGARVIAAAGNPDKLAIAREHGADELIDYSRESVRDRVRELTGGQGVDVVFDPVGGDVFDQALRAVNWKARLLVVGFAAGRIQAVPANLVLVKNISIIGVSWGMESERDPALASRHLAELLRWWEAGRLKPLVARTFPLAEIAAAMRALLSRRYAGKIVLEV
jgi:NADPH2:quinone reductase